MSGDALSAVIERIQQVFGGWTGATTLGEMRRDWASLYADDPVPAATDDITVEGVPCRWVAAPGTTEGAVFLYLHGGGFQMGSLDTHTPVVARISAASGMRGLVVGYRLAPEHQYPAPLEDARAAYSWVLAQGHSPSKVLLCGDSAGGGLCLSLMVALRDDACPLPVGAAIMSAWTDMTASGASYETRKDADPLHQRAMMETIARTYLGKTGDPKDPLASPLFAELTGLPPLLIQVGEREVVLDDSRRLAEAARAAGVDVTLDVASGMIHAFQLYAKDLKEGRAAIADVGAFLRDRVGQTALRS